ANDVGCFCGYNSKLVASPPSTIYYFANQGQYYTAASATTGTWTTVANYVSPVDNRRGEAGVGILGGKFYWVGGRGPVKTVQTFDFASTYKVGPPPASYPIAISSPASLTFNNKLWIFSGQTVGTSTMASNVYDPAADTWTAKAD